MLKSLSEAEVREFGNFLMGVPHQKTGNVYKLYIYLKQFYLKKQSPKFKSKYIKKEYVAKKLFKDVSGRTLSDTSHRLSNALEDFLIKKRLENDAVTKNFLRLEMYKERKLDVQFFQKINALEREWLSQQNQISGIESFHSWYQLIKMRFLYPNEEIGNKIPLELISWLDKYYISIKLYWTLGYKINNNLDSNSEMAPQYFIDEIMENSKLEDFNKVPQIRILSKLITATNSNNYDNYNEIRDDLLHCFDSDLFNESEKSGLYTVLNYFCFCNFQREKPNARSNLFELNKLAVEKKWLLENGNITPQTFRNTVRVFCLVKETDWAVTFIQNYGKYIKEEFREDTILICEAQIAMNQNEYELAQNKLIPITKFKNVFFSILAKSLELQCYFELDGCEEVFFNKAKNFNQYLNRKEKSKDIKYKVATDFKNFIYYIKIIKKEFNKSNNKKILEKILEETSLKQDIANKGWLINKLNFLLGPNQK